MKEICVEQQCWIENGILKKLHVKKGLVILLVTR